MNKWLVPISALLFAIAIGVFYGQMRYNQGYTKGELLLAEERINLHKAHLEEIARLENIKYETEQRYEELEDKTERERSNSNSIIERLRKQVDDARHSQRGEATSPANGTRGDWIGGFAACVEEYASLGGDCARTADKLRGLQEFNERIQKR